MLLLLLLLPLFVAVYIRNGRRRQRLAAVYGSHGFAQAAGRAGGVRRHLPAAVYLLALAVLLLSAARPEATVALPRLEGTVLLVFDVSGSMAADDMAPTRMEAAKAAARDFVAQIPATVQVGVVSFSEGGFATQAPTADQETILASIERLSIQRGTSLGIGIEAALNALAVGSSEAPLTLSTRRETPTPAPVAPGTYSSAMLVLFTDGENTQAPDPLEAAQLAADRGVRVHTVGVGSPEGATLEIDGFNVRSRLDEAMLRQIAGLTGGAYQRLAGGDDLSALFDTLSTQLVVKPENTEITSLFAGAGMLFLMLGAVLSMVWLGRLP